MDLFLENEFFYVFSETLQSMIVSDDIEITARHSLRALEPNEFDYIERRVFLLSFYETGGRVRPLYPRRRMPPGEEILPEDMKYNPMPEGQRLAYFGPTGWGRFVTSSTTAAEPRRIASTESGQVWPWWLRTPQTINRTTQGSVVSTGGGHGSAAFFLISGPGEMGVRPAFRLPSDTPIRRGELGREMVFFIDY